MQDQGIPMQRLRDGKWEAEVQLEDDGENHPELRGPQQDKIGDVLSGNHIHYLCDMNRREQIH